MADSDIAGNLSALVKEMYPNEEVGSTLMEGSALFAEMDKDWETYGDPVAIPVKYASGSGASNNFAAAQAAHDGSQTVKFQLTMADEFAIFRITEKAIQASKGDMGAITNLLEHETDDALSTLKRNMHRGIYRNGGGAIGQIASGSGTQTITLANVGDIVHFMYNMKVQSAGTDGTSGTVDPEIATISAINEDLGTITRADANWSAGGYFAANDHLFPSGNFGAAATGLAGWVPLVAPTSTPFYQVDRTVAVNALGGVRDAATAGDGTIMAFLQRFASRMARGKARPDRCYLNPVNFGQLVREMVDQIKYEMVIPKNSQGMEMQGAIGFQAVILAVGSGVIKVFSEADCPYGLCYMLTLKSWKIRGYSEPGLLNKDGLSMARRDSAASYEGRFGCFWNVSCNAPGHNGVGDLTDVLDPLT